MGLLSRYSLLRVCSSQSLLHNHRHIVDTPTLIPDDLQALSHKVSVNALLL